MENEYWFTKNYNLKYEFVKNNIENNDYYEYIRGQYNKEDADKDDIINDILHCFDDIYNGYYSIYIIMDSIEEYLETHKNSTIEQAVADKDFTIKDY